MKPDKPRDAGAASRRKAIVFAGPTASGKSAAALACATALGGVVINADSMQIYRELPLLTAQPDLAARAAAPHRLYGILGADDPCSAGRWRALALVEIEEAVDARRLPILAGGTGLYLRALMRGLAPVPPIPPEIRKRGRECLQAEGVRAFRARLAAVDPEAAAALPPGDRQRLLRAWEVVAATGRTLAQWRALRSGGDSPELLVLAFLPPRAVLYEACDRRFEAMIDAGVIEEVRSFLARGLDPALPVMKAVGLREVAAYLGGETDLGQVLAAGKTATRRYAKRQYTWLRHQLPGVFSFPAQFSESLLPEIFSKIRDFVLTPPRPVD